MLCIDTELRFSAVNGIGLFTKQKIRKGEVIWQFSPGLDLVINQEELKNLPRIVQQQLLHYCYKANGKYVLCFDDARFINHSDNPNAKDEHKLEASTIADRDIEVGEEIFCNYSNYDDEWKRHVFHQ